MTVDFLMEKYCLTDANPQWVLIIRFFLVQPIYSTIFVILGDVKGMIENISDFYKRIGKQDYDAVGYVKGKSYFLEKGHCHVRRHFFSFLRLFRRFCVCLQL